MEDLVFCQDNHSRSSAGVLRGLHYQLSPEAQGKLVRCSVGSIFDVAVDLRRKSPTYRQWVGAFLTSENHCQLWVPKGFAHGFLTLSQSSEVLYKSTGYWNQPFERSLRWDDPTIAIDWPIESIDSSNPFLSYKDANAPLLSSLEALGEVF